MFPLFITHDEYFVWCGGSGGGYYDVFDLSSYELLSGRRQCGGSALAAARRRRAAWRRCWQRGGGGGRAVAARRRQRGNDSVAVVAVRRQCGGGQQGGGVGSAVALAARWQQPAWRLRRKFGGNHSVSGGSRAAGAALPPRAVTVATKTPAATAMAGALPTINNQLKVAATMAMKTTTTTTHKM
jgi:hypothetical protein